MRHCGPGSRQVQVRRSPLRADSLALLPTPGWRRTPAARWRSLWSNRRRQARGGCALRARPARLRCSAPHIHPAAARATVPETLSAGKNSWRATTVPWRRLGPLPGDFCAAESAAEWAARAARIHIKLGGTV